MIETSVFGVRTVRAMATIAVAFALCTAACTPAARKSEIPIFFPPAPAPPRIQYLTYFTGVNDIEEQSTFNRFVVGEKQDLQVDKPYGVGVYDGKIYVCDTNATVTVFDLKAKTFSFLKGAFGQGALKQPVNISITEDGTKYVSDPVRGQVVVFDRNDEYVKAYGAAGTWRPVDAVARDNRVFAADVARAVVTIFDRQTGAPIKSFGDGGDPSERMSRPTNLAFDPAGYLYVTDAGRFQILKFDRDGHFKGTIGKLGNNLGHFARPKGVAIDREGRIYAVDASFNNVQIFNKDGRLLMFFGESGNKPGGFVLPAKVALDYDNMSYFQQFAKAGFKMDYLIFVTSQFGDRRVNVFGHGQEEGQRYPTDAELLKEIDERRAKERAQQPDKQPEKQPEPAP